MVLKSNQRGSQDGAQLLHWYPILKHPPELLEYSHPKMKEYIDSLVASTEAIFHENVVLQKEDRRLREQVKIYEQRL